MGIRHVNIVENLTTEVIVLPMAKCAKSAGRNNHFKSVCRIGNGNDKYECESSCSMPKKGHKGKCFHKVNEKNETMDDLADQVQSLFYHDVHFNAINM